LPPQFFDLAHVVGLELRKFGSHLLGLLHFVKILPPGSINLGFKVVFLFHRGEAFPIRSDTLRLPLLALALDLRLLTVVLGILSSLLILDGLHFFAFVSKLGLDELLIGLSSLIKLGETQRGLLLHALNLGVLAVDLGFGLHQVRMELVHFIEAGYLALLVVHDIFLLFLNVVHGRLNLGCQVLHEHLQVVLLLLLLDPGKRLLLLFEDVDLLGGQLGLGTSAKEEREVLWVDCALRLHPQHACRD